MFAWLALLFIMVPLVELAVLLKVGSLISVGPTIAIVILTGVVGAALARRQGFRAVTRIRMELSQGRMPTTELAEGFLILLAGVLLITPGFITDLVGIVLLVPGSRRLIGRGLMRLIRSRIEVMHISTGAADTRRGAGWAVDSASEAGRRPVKYVENRAMDGASS